MHSSTEGTENQSLAAEDAQWACLPPNVLIQLFLKLSLQELCTAAAVCSTWRSAAQADQLWQCLLQDHYCRSTPTHHAMSCRQCLMQLKTGSLLSCGSAWPLLTASAAGATYSSRGTELVQLWSNTLQPGATALPLQRYCQLPDGYAVTAVAAGKSHLVLLSCTGDVIDTRVGNAAAATEQAPAAPAVAAEAEPGAAAGQALDAPAAAAVADLPDDLDVLAAGQEDAEGEDDVQQALMLQEEHNQQLQQQLGVLHMVNPWQPLGAQVVAIAAGGMHVLAVTSCGQVWGWGSNECGQLGLGHSKAWVAAPTEVTAALDGAWKAPGDVITAVACGDLHSVLLAANGGVYTAGCNKQGQCGQSEALQLCPVFCQPSQACRASPIKAAAVACGTANTAIATAQGRLLVCGDASSGQCGAGCIKARCCWQFVDLGPEIGWHGLNRPTTAQVAAAGGDLAQALPKVVQVAAGCGTCYALTEEGEVYAWGAGSKGQLGRGGCTKVQATPAKLPWAKRVTQVSASLDGQFAAAIDTAGHLYTWGAGKWGQLGHGDTSKRTVGRAVKLLKHVQVLQAVCGGESLVVLTCARPHQHQQQDTTPAGSRDRDTKGVKAHLDRASSVAGSSDMHGHANQGRSSFAAAAEEEHAGGMLGDMSMDGVDWVDVDGRGPYYCPAPRTGSSRRGSRASRRQAAVAMFDTPSGSYEDDSPAAAAAAAVEPAADLHRYGSGSSNSSNASSRPCQQQQHRQSRTWKQQQVAAGGSPSSSSSSGGPLLSSSAVAYPACHSPPGAAAEAAEAAVVEAARQHSRRLNTGAAAGGPEALIGQHSIKTSRSCRTERCGATDSAGTATPGRAEEQQGEGRCSLQASRSASTTEGSDAHELAGGSPSYGSSTSGGGLPGNPGRHPRMDKGFRRLLKRLLKNFVSDSRQRELAFPSTLSSADRYHVHVAAEAWGLGHASHNDGEERVIKVWKVSRARRMRSGPDPDFGSD